MSRRILLLSPHPDDIAWSLGGTVSRLRARCTLHTLTFFTRTRYVPGAAGVSDDQQASALRHREERNWAELAGTELSRGALPDASLRGFDDDSELGGQPEPEILAAVAALLRPALAQLRPELVLAPLAAGGHVDHTAVRHVMAGSAYAGDLWWYEDLPYAGEPNGDLAQAGMHPLVVDIAGWWPAKEAGIRCFPSQLPEAILPTARRHAASVGGERIWTGDPAARARASVLLGLDRQPGPPIVRPETPRPESCMPVRQEQL